MRLTTPRAIIVTRDVPKKPTRHAAANGGAGGERENRDDARSEPSADWAESSRFPLVRRSYQPVADLDERLRRIFALLSHPPSDDEDH